VLERYGKFPIPDQYSGLWIKGSSAGSVIENIETGTLDLAKRTVGSGYGIVGTNLNLYHGEQRLLF